MATFPSASDANGIWRLNAIRDAIMGQNWPNSNYVVEVFTTTTNWTCPAGVASVEYLVVAGGGGGGYNSGGGGGADAFIPSTSVKSLGTTRGTLDVEATDVGTTDIQVLVDFTAQNGDGTTGAATVTVLYLQARDLL